MQKLKQFFTDYKNRILVLIYVPIYLICFFLLEQNVTTDYRIIHMAIDDYIPFCEIFVIPYYLWFAYIAVTVLYFFFKDEEDYYKTCFFLFTGMTIFIIVSALWPNGHHLRPSVLPRDNVFTRLVEGLWQIDTATNLWPSIHVYNSLGIHIAIAQSKHFKEKPVIRGLSLVLAVSIILSTVLIKQHSMFDVLTAFIMTAVMYWVVYRYDIVARMQKHSVQHKEAKTV